MASRKKKARKKKASSARIAVPVTLGQVRKPVARQLSRLEVEIEKAASSARREATQLLRDASLTLDRYESRTEKTWREMTRNAARDAEQILDRLEDFLGEARGAVRKAAAARRDRKSVV